MIAPSVLAKMVDGACEPIVFPSDSRCVPCVVLALLSAQLKFSNYTLRQIL